ncbi:MAG: hypothetical protein OWU84_00635 [Firmicutes bacterium]|nr:hypothetical protein [Bacillota bacterium]
MFPHAGFSTRGLWAAGRFWWQAGTTGWATQWSAPADVTAVATQPGIGEAVAWTTAGKTPRLTSLTIAASGRIVHQMTHALPAPMVGMDWLTARRGWIWSSAQLWVHVSLFNERPKSGDVRESGMR